MQRGLNLTDRAGEGCLIWACRILDMILAARLAVDARAIHPADEFRGLEVVYFVFHISKFLLRFTGGLIAAGGWLLGDGPVKPPALGHIIGPRFSPHGQCGSARFA